MKKVLFVVISFVFCNYSNASYTCAGEVKGVGIDPKSGAVLVQKIGTLEWPRLCSVNGDFNGITPEACKIVYTTLLTAQAAKKKVRLWFNDENDCTKEKHTPWHPLTGWYFGPVLEG